MLPPPVVVSFTQLRIRIPVCPKHFNLNLPFATLLSRTIGFALPKSPHSTVTLFAKFLGLSTSVPLAQAV